MKNHSGGVLFDKIAFPTDIVLQSSYIGKRINMLTRQELETLYRKLIDNKNKYVIEDGTTLLHAEFMYLQLQVFRLDAWIKFLERKLQQ